jgi:hypothetical protein
VVQPFELQVNVNSEIPQTEDMGKSNKDLKVSLSAYTYYDPVYHGYIYTNSVDGFPLLSNP